MNKLNINRANLVDVPHQPSALDKSWFGNGSRAKAVRAEGPNADSRFNNFTSSQPSSRPSSAYFSLSQPSSQPTFTESQISLSQNSLQSDPGINCDLWRYGSRGRDFSNKRPRSPNRPAFPSYFRNNVKDGASTLPLTPTPTSLSTTPGLLQRTPDLAKEKCSCAFQILEDDIFKSQLKMSYERSERVVAGITRVESLAGTLTEVMEQRLIVLDNCLNGIFGGLDGLQKNIYNVQATVKEAAVESDINRQKEAVRQHLLQTLVDQAEENRKNFVVLKTIPETVRDEMKKLQIEVLADAVKKIPNQIAEQITEMKAELLRTMKKEFQVAITNWRRTEPLGQPGLRRSSMGTIIGESEDNPKSYQAMTKVACTRTGDVVSQKVLRGTTANENFSSAARKSTKARHCKDDSRSKRPQRGKRCTTLPPRSASDHRSSKENVQYGYQVEEGHSGDGAANANISRQPPENLAISGTSGFRSKELRPKRALNRMPSEAGWISVRRSEDENQASLQEAHVLSECPLISPDRDVPTQALLQKASNSETQCDPVVELINTEGDDTNTLVYLASKEADRKEKSATLPAEVIEVSEDSLDETRLIRQRLKARRRRFHCL